MTAEAMSGLPFQAGSAVAAAAGRTALWAVGLYMQQPLRNTALLALVSLSAMAGGNALYHQAHHHPAPLFGAFDPAPPAAKAKKPAAPVMPVTRPKILDLGVSPDTTGSIDAGKVQPIGNADVMAIQKQLKALSLFDGSADGLFGPRTAKAIRAYEAKTGRPSTGQLTAQIVAAIKGAPLAVDAEPAAPAILPQATAEPQPVAVASAAPALALAPVDDSPLPAPAPLTLTDASPAPAAETTTDVAELAPVDANGVQSLPMTAPPSVTKRSVQTIAVHALRPAADATAPAVPAPEAAVVPDAAPDATVSPAVAADADSAPAEDSADISTDPKTVGAVQRGLNSLGFLHGAIDGVATEATARAIRNFEVYYNYDVTGRISKALVKLLVQNGAVI